MDKEKGVQQVHRNRHKLSVTRRRSVYGASLRVGNAAVPGTDISSMRVSGERLRLLRRNALAPYRSMMRIGIYVPFLPGSFLSVSL